MIGYLPQQLPFSSFEKGGFYFGDYSHKGAVLSLPHGTFAASVEISLEHLQEVFKAQDVLDLFILGGGEKRIVPVLEVRQAFKEAKIALESLSTSQAISMFNIVLGEKRRVGGLFLPL